MGGKKLRPIKAGLMERNYFDISHDGDRFSNKFYIEREIIFSIFFLSLSFLQKRILSHNSTQQIELFNDIDFY